MDQVWEARRQQLRAVLRIAALDYFQHTGTMAFITELDQPGVDLHVAAGTAKDIKDLAAGTIEKMAPAR